MRNKLAAVLLGAMAIAAAPTLAACSDPDPLVYTTDDDAAVNAAMLEARNSLPVFWAKYDANSPGYDAFALKVGLDSDGGGVEHIWVHELRREDGKIFGLIANEPVDLEDLSVGSPIEIEPGRISDWQYAKNGKLYGHFTSRALSAKASPEQRAMAAEMFAPTPLEAGTQ